MRASFRESRRGFTTIELVIVVVIVGVLASIAVPMYRNAVRQARVSEGLARISDIATAARCFAQMNAAAGDPVWPAAGEGLMDLSSRKGKATRSAETAPWTSPWPSISDPS